jgi:hypothetical protein
MLLAHAKLPILQSQISFLRPNPTLLQSHIIIPFSKTMQQSHATSQGFNCMSEPYALVLVPKPNLTEPCIRTFHGSVHVLHYFVFVHCGVKNYALTQSLVHSLATVH